MSELPKSELPNSTSELESRATKLKAGSGQKTGSGQWSGLRKIRRFQIRMIGGFIFSVSIVLAPGALADDDLSELIKSWDLVGRWSTDCTPGTTSRGVVAYEFEPDGRAIIDNGQNLTELKIARINAEGDLTLHTNPTGGGEIRILLLRRTGDALRPSTSGDEQNDYSMREGKFVASLKETSLIRRCGG
jgi:hypothetical protein